MPSRDMVTDSDKVHVLTALPSTGEEAGTNLSIWHAAGI